MWEEKWLDSCQKVENIVPVPLLLAPLDERHDVSKTIRAPRCADELCTPVGGIRRGGLIQYEVGGVDWRGMPPPWWPACMLGLHAELASMDAYTYG